MFAALLILFLQLSPANFPTNTPNNTIEGAWNGTIANQLRVVLELARRPDGNWSGTLTSVDQGGAKMALDGISFRDGVLKFNIPQVAGAYEGKLDGAEIAGVWHQGTTLTLVFKRGASPGALKPRPQEPKRPYPYEEYSVTYDNLFGAVTLAATLTVPRGKGPFPAVVLITGSGAQNRDEELFGHKPFRVLADYLTRRGFAVLRADDRGVGGSSGNVAQSTTADFAVDALAGVRFLKTRQEIDARRIGLIGHSEGGVVAPMAAAASPDVAFIVLMAGTGIDGEHIVAMQNALIDQVSGRSDLERARNHEATVRVLALLREERDPAALERRLRELVRQAYLAEGKSASELGPMVEATAREMLSPWFRAFLALDPTVALKRVRCPVLALIGERDLQVPPKENIRAIADALRAGGNHDATVRELPGLNHLFQTAKSGLPTEYGEIDETIAPSALAAIGDWLTERAKR